MRFAMKRTIIITILIFFSQLFAQRSVNINQSDHISADEINSSVTALDSAETFTGIAEEIINESAITILIRADQSGTGEVQYSKDATNWDLKIPFSYTATDSLTKYIFGSHARWFRIVYTNGATAQTYFRMQTIFHKEPLLTYTNGKLDANIYTTSSTPVATYTSGNLWGAGYAQTVTTETDTIAFTSATKFANFNVWSDNDTLLVSLEGAFSTPERVLPYTSYSISNIDPATYTEIYIKRAGTTGTVIYDYSWLGR